MRRVRTPLVQVFASRVRSLRISLGLSQEGLAEKAGLHRTYVGSIERAERNVSLENIGRLADALGVFPDQLLTEGEDSEKRPKK